MEECQWVLAFLATCFIAYVFLGLLTQALYETFRISVPTIWDA